MSILWILMIVFGILAVVFFMGKGSFLIAGYNAASKEEKAQYDEKKLSHVMAIAMTVITILLLFSALNENLAFWLLPIGILLTIIVLIIVTNTLCKKENTPCISHSKNKRSIIASLCITTVVGGIIIVVLFLGNVHITLNESYLEVSTSLTTSTTIYYRDIESITYTKNIEIGNQTNGIGTFKLQAGDFKNDSYGKYRLYLYTHCKTYIVLETKNGIVVLNDNDTAKTLQLYTEINAKIPK